MESEKPKNWQQLSNYVRWIRAKGACEKCGAVHGTPCEDGGWVFLDVVAVDPEKGLTRVDNLVALCPACRKVHEGDPEPVVGQMSLKFQVES